jgi:nucleotide-binding universal stress UspA family protein
MTTTSPIKRILVATDFSECAGRALNYATFLAGVCSAPVELLHVVDILQDQDYGGGQRRGGSIL